MQNDKGRALARPFSFIKCKKITLDNIYTIYYNNIIKLRGKPLSR